jgi:predicted transcriptional regulator of viral defense system
MEFADVLGLVGDEPTFDSALLFAGAPDLPYLQRQLSRWVGLGYLQQLRRQHYVLAAPYQKTRPHPFLIANRMVRASYVSGESALAFHGLIPEYVPAITSVTTQRPARWTNPYGQFLFQHIKVSSFFGYERVELSRGQYAFVATPEKALLDLIHLRRGADAQGHLQELRLQHFDKFDFKRLDHYVERLSSPKLTRAARHLRAMAAAESSAYEELR